MRVETARAPAQKDPGDPKEIKLAAGIVYSPRPMTMENPSKKPNIEGLEGRVEELEGLADDLANAPDEELVEVLNRAVNLLGTVNADIEAGIRSVGEGVNGVGEALDRTSFGDFDAALGDLEEREQGPGE